MNAFIQKKYANELLSAASSGNITMWLAIETELIKAEVSGEDIQDSQVNNLLHLAVQV